MEDRNAYRTWLTSQAAPFSSHLPFMDELFRTTLDRVYDHIIVCPGVNDLFSERDSKWVREMEKIGVEVFELEEEAKTLKVVEDVLSRIEKGGRDLARCAVITTVEEPVGSSLARLDVVAHDRTGEFSGLPSINSGLRLPTAFVYTADLDTERSIGLPISKYAHPFTWVAGLEDLEGDIAGIPVGGNVPLESVVLCQRRINLGFKHAGVQSGELLFDFEKVAEKAIEHKDQALGYLDSVAPDHVLALLDNQSGAVEMDALSWKRLERGIEESDPSFALFEILNQRLPDYWTTDRPCLSRVLYTPSHVLMRGEMYYINMKNISPILRMEKYLDEVDLLLEEGPSEMVSGKIFSHLFLAFLDQFRNAFLVGYAFCYESIVFCREKKDVNLEETFKQILSLSGWGLEKLLSEAIYAYYHCLVGNVPEAFKRYETIKDKWERVRNRFVLGLDELKKLSTGQNIGRLMRRWREADHPAENILVALAAYCRQEGNRDGRTAVGIGWGGIELPIVYSFVEQLISGESSCKVILASYSHYRGENKTVSARSFPNDTEVQDCFVNRECLLLDDNVLTGITLEMVREYLLVNGAKTVSCFVTRYSGERRHAHMKMEGHGVADPGFLTSCVGGYLGETHFARSWSTRSYKNPIGVFSISRRRILECIHNNSTVELYDREGF